MTDENPKHRAGDEPLIGDAPPEAKTLLSSNAYDKLKPLAHIWLPALALFYITIAPLWGLPKSEEVSATIVALDLLLGTVLGISSKQFKNAPTVYDGRILVSQGEGPNESNLDVSLKPLAVASKKELVVRVDRA